MSVLYVRSFRQKPAQPFNEVYSIFTRDLDERHMYLLYIGPRFETFAYVVRIHRRKGGFRVTVYDMHAKADLITHDSATFPLEYIHDDLRDTLSRLVW